MDGIFFGRNRNNLVALYPYSQALRKGSKSSAIYWIKEIVIIARMVPIVKALLVFSINLISPRLPVLCCVVFQLC